MGEQKTKGQVKKQTIEIITTPLQPTYTLI